MPLINAVRSLFSNDCAGTRFGRFFAHCAVKKNLSHVHFCVRYVDVKEVVRALNALVVLVVAGLLSRTCCYNSLLFLTYLGVQVCNMYTIQSVLKFQSTRFGEIRGLACRTTAGLVTIISFAARPSVLAIQSPLGRIGYVETPILKMLLRW
jgi:hypothetical protein